MIDEYKDVSCHEQLSVCVRYVLDNHPIERFYTSCELPQQDAKTIAKTYLIPIIKQISTSSVLVGFGSDGASVMSGEHGGVLKHLKEHAYVFYV